MKEKIKKIVRKIWNPDYEDSPVYGKLYYPIYNKNVKIDSYVPEIYNKAGERMELFFIRDGLTAHAPYSRGRYFFWDRFNFELKKHFYTHKQMLCQIGKPDFKYGMLIESESIVPNDYEIFQQHKGIEKDFDLIFSFSDRILNEVPNARFVPFCSVPWYGTEQFGGLLSADAYKTKTKNVSIVSSDKLMCHLHRIRYDIAWQCKHKNLADTYGTFDGGKLIKLSESLSDYRYSIAIENDISPYFFTERITSCFASMTVPIYLGASKISEFFNPDGIIFLDENSCENIEVVLSQCNEKDYEARLPAIIDNFNRVKKFLSWEDYMYEHYLQDRNK